MKASLGNLAVRDVDQLAAIMKNRLKRIQYRPALIEAFLGQAGLNSTPSHRKEDANAGLSTSVAAVHGCLTSGTVLIIGILRTERRFPRNRMVTIFIRRKLTKS